MPILIPLEMFTVGQYFDIGGDVVTLLLATDHSNSRQRFRL